MKGVPTETDFLVIGASVAGLRAAIELADAGRVLVLSKNDLPDFKTTDSKSEAEWLSDEDEVSLHLQDTLDAGDALCNQQAVKVLVEEGVERIEELMIWAKPVAPTLTFELENPHSRVRVLHAQGGSTAKQILGVLFEKAHSLKNIAIAPRTFVTELLTNGQKITGVSLLDDKGMPQDVACSIILLEGSDRSTGTPPTLQVLLGMA